MRTEYKESELVTIEDVGLVFKTRDGREYKLTALVKETREGEHVAVLVDKDMTDILLLTRKGKDHDKPKLYNTDLVSLVGPDFTDDKKPRKFEFEGYFDHSPESPVKGDKWIVGLPKEKKIENFIQNIKLKDESLSKYKIIIEELPND